MVELANIEFGTDGIRGIAGEYPLDPATVLRIGRALGRWLRTQDDRLLNVVIGRDTRISGHMISHALIAGLLSEDVNFVSDAGVLTTPGIAHLTRQGNFSLGIVISASHNPFDQNGIKVFGPDGFKLPDASERTIERLIMSLKQDENADGLGFTSNYDAESRYIDHLLKGDGPRPLSSLSIVLDCANGAGSHIAPAAFERSGAHVTALNADPDGFNINVEAGSEYVRRNRSVILSAIQERGADLGIAFDGDADRVVFVTPEGMLVDGDHLLGILAVDLQRTGKLPHDTVVATDMSNTGLEDYLIEHDIALTRTKVGDRYVMERMRQNGYTLGGEQAGHVIVLDSDHTAGDGIFVGLRVASIVAANKRNGGPTLHEMASRIPRYPQVIASAHLNARVDLATLPELETVKAQTLERFGGRGRVNVRFSGTEPNLLRAMVEGGPGTSLDLVIGQALALCEVVAQATSTPQPEIDLVDCETGAPVMR